MRQIRAKTIHLDGQRNIISLEFTCCSIVPIVAQDITKLLVNKNLGGSIIHSRLSCSQGCNIAGSYPHAEHNNTEK
jgi:hypothetical protein